jgi:hypothetical protein
MKNTKPNKHEIRKAILLTSAVLSCVAVGTYVGGVMLSDTSLNSPIVTTIPVTMPVVDIPKYVNPDSQTNVAHVTGFHKTSDSKVSQNLITEMASNFTPTSYAGETAYAPFNNIRLSTIASGKTAIDQLGSNLNNVASWYGLTSNEFKQQLLNDSTMHLDTKGRVLYVDDHIVPNEGVMATEVVTASVAATTMSKPFPYEQTFLLHSKPDSTRSLYINFTGQGTNPPFDLDKSAFTFSNAERLLIQKVWMRVAEVYSAFDVDVTTERPANIDGQTGSTILVTPKQSTIGGYAYLNSFGAAYTSTANAFCYPNNLANNEKFIADCVSHEFGHTLGLAHQGQLPYTPYYLGQGVGETGWAPIMGVGYYKKLVQWSKGEYVRASNKSDAYSIMLTQGLPLRDATHSSVITNASAMSSSLVNGYNNLTAGGIIRSSSDINMLKFVSGEGQLSVTVRPYMLGGTLHTSLQVLDSNGVVLITSMNDTTLTAAVKLMLPTAGTYYLKISGRGAGNPLATGYSNYGSIGQYTVNATSSVGSMPIK